MNTKHISYILEIAEQKNITKAAELLYVSQSTLSQCLANLESELGTPLFYRNSKELVPTPAGLRYLEGARQILEIKKQVYQDIGRIAAGLPVSFTIGIASQSGLRRFSKVSALFKDKYPNATFQVIEDHTQPLMKMLANGKLDIAVLAVDSLDRLSTPYELIQEEELFLAIPNVEKFAKYEKNGEICWEEMNQAPFILSPKDTIIWELEEKMIREHKINPYVICEISSKRAVLSMLEEGVGLSLIPQSLVSDHNNIRFLSVKPRLCRYHVAAYSRKEAMGVEMEYFIQLMKNAYGEDRIAV